MFVPDTFINLRFRGLFTRIFFHQVQLCTSFGTKFSPVMTIHFRSNSQFFRGLGCSVGRELRNFVVGLGASEILIFVCSSIVDTEIFLRQK